MAENLLGLFREIIGFIFHTDKPDNILYSIVTLIIIGLIGLTFRYIFYWVKKEEKSEWLKLDVVSKPILSLIVGLISYILALSINYIVNTIFKTIDSDYSLQNLFILILTTIFAVSLKYFKKQEKKSFENVRKFFAFYLLVSIFIFLLAINYEMFIQIFGVIRGSVAVVGFDPWMLIFIVFIFIMTILYYARIAEFTFLLFKRKILFYNICIKLLKKWKIKKR